MSTTKSVSFRQTIEEHELLVERAKEANLKPAVLAADVVRKWITGQLVPASEVLTPQASEVSRLEAQRFESIVCRAIWTVVVALSPTLDEAASVTVVNELMKPTRTDWASQ